jgi:glycosyltransferase involved in cell wall biosynthesis
MHHVVIVNDFAYINGGASKVAIDSALGLGKAGVDVTFFSAVGPAIPLLEQNGVRAICLGQEEIAKDPNRLRAVVRGLWNAKAGRRMADLLRGLDPGRTIIHVHGWTKALSSSPIAVALRSGFKVIFTLHDYFIGCPNGGFYNYKSDAICTLKPLSAACIATNCDSRNYLQKQWRVLRQVIQRKKGLIPDGIRHFITISDFSERVLSPYLPKGACVYRVSNPISMEKKLPVDLAANTAFVMVGRVSPEKGVQLFAKAVQELGVEGIIIGDGPIRKLVQQQFPAIRYTGWLKPEEVRRVLSAARCLVFPSLCYETQGLAVLEAAALGIPAIVADTSAARDLVIDGVTGLWFKGGDLLDLKEKMKKLATDTKFAAEAGLAAYRCFWENPPTLERHVKELIGVYSSMLAD